jgi:hypothetical protein
MILIKYFWKAVMKNFMVVSQNLNGKGEQKKKKEFLQAVPQ